MDLAIWVNAIVLMDIKVRIVPRAFVQFCAQLMDIMEAEFVIARMVGRDRNAIFQLPSVKRRLARVMDDALKENVIAIVDGRDRFVIKVRTSI